jgi:hypothetical protein
LPMPREPPVTSAVRPAKEKRDWVSMNNILCEDSGGAAAQLARIMP